MCVCKARTKPYFLIFEIFRDLRVPATEPFLTTAEIERVFSAGTRVQRMLDFEAALVIAQCAAGVVPASARDTIVAACRADRFDASAILIEVRTAGNGAIPLVCELIEQVRSNSPAAADWVHWGATSQDMLDTTMVLQLREACDLVSAQLQAAESTIAKLANTHLRTPMVARTLLQHATATTLGYKLAVWGNGIERARASLQQLHDDAFALQLGGASGTLSAMGEQAFSIRRAVAAHFGLNQPVITWHTQRDRFLSIATGLAMSITACAKFASDLVLMMQSEVGEVIESATNAGGSSAMPNKRNPVATLVPIAAAANSGGLLAALFNASVHEHERAAGAWHGEWFALPQLAALAHASATATAEVAAGTVFNPARMRENLDGGGGLIAAEALTIALAKRSGKVAARKAVDSLCAEVRKLGGTLAGRVAGTAEISRQLSPQEIAAVFNHDAAIDSAAQAAQLWLNQRVE